MEYQHTAARIRGTHEQSQNITTFFLCGDVMTGRGIDQILAHPSDPVIYESYMKSARGYVRIAEEANGPIEPLPVDDSYIWGDALQVLDKIKPDVRMINLETSVTRHDRHCVGKPIQYRMHPRNIGCITSARIDCCILGNNHVLDWREEGLRETLQVLKGAGIATCGAGENINEARKPAILPQKKGTEDSGRILVISMGSSTSGVPKSWAATAQSPGVFHIDLMSTKDVKLVAEQILREKRQGDIAIASVHMGSNWGYDVPEEQRLFCHRLIDQAGVDVVHGHSSHHPKGIEVYHGKPIFYGVGDFLNDYEGIHGHEEFRSDLTLMYFVSMDTSTRQLTRLHMVPLRIRNFKLNLLNSAHDLRWMRDMMTREGKKFDNWTEIEDVELELKWE